MGNIATKLASKSAEFKRMFLGQFPEKQLIAGNSVNYYQTLTDFDFIDLKIQYSKFGVEALIRDYLLIEDTQILEILEEGEKLNPEEINTLKLIQQTLELSSHVLNQDPNQLVGQLWGRLQSFEKSDIQKILTDAAKSKSEIPRFRPLTATLTTAGGNLLRTLTGHNDWVNAVAITPDGKKAVSGSGDDTLKVWDLDTGKEISTLTGHNSWVNAVAITPDGKKAVSGSHDSTLKVWDLDTGKEISTFIGDSPISCCAVSPDGLTIVAGEGSGRVHFLRLEGGNKHE